MQSFFCSLILLGLVIAGSSGSAQTYQEPKREDAMIKDGELGGDEKIFDRVHKSRSVKDAPTSVSAVATLFADAVKNRDKAKLYGALANYNSWPVRSSFEGINQLYATNTELKFDTANSKVEVKGEWSISKTNTAQACNWKEITRVPIQDVNGAVKTYAFVKCSYWYQMKAGETACPSIYERFHPAGCGIETLSSGLPANGTAVGEAKSNPASH